MGLFSSPTDQLELSQIGPVFKEFCYLLDKEEASRYEADKSFLIYGKVILSRLSKGDFITALDLKVIEAGLIKLQLDVCKALIASLEPKLTLLAQKKYKTPKITDAIREIEHRYKADDQGSIAHVRSTFEALRSSNLASYHKPSKDPQKIHLLNALGILLTTLI